MTPITFLEKQPRKFFYKKPFKRKVFNNNALKLRLNKANVQYNYYGLRALESGQIKYRQVEAVRKVFLFFFREESNLLIKLQFNSPIISRSLGVRMGRGKGKVSH